MPNALDLWLKNVIGPTLRPQGFRGGPRRFDRRSDGLVSGLQFQGSSINSTGRARFTLNYGIWHAGIGQLTGNDNPHEWHIARRVGGATDRWWDLGIIGDNSDVARDVLNQLSSEVLPFLDRVGTPAGFKAYWLSQPEPGRSEFVRLLAEAEAYDAAADPRTAEEKQLDRMAQDPRVRDWLTSDPIAARWVAWCESCGRPAIRGGAPTTAMPIAMLLARGAPTLATETICDSCARLGPTSS